MSRRPSSSPTVGQGVVSTLVLIALAAIPLWWSTDEVETGNRLFLLALAVLLLALAVWRGDSTTPRAHSDGSIAAASHRSGTMDTMAESRTDRSPRASSARFRPRAPVESVVAGLALAAVVATWGGLLLLVDGSVMPLPLLAVVAAALVLIAQGRSVRSAVRRVRVWSAALALVLGLLTVTVDVGVGTTYRLLPEASSQGCRVVAREDSFLMGGGGSLYMLRGESGVARRVLSFSTDDGERPFTNGSAELRWRGEAGTVTGPLWVSSAYGPVAFSC